MMTEMAGRARQGAGEWLSRLDPLAAADGKTRVLAAATFLALCALPALFLAPLFNAPFEPDQGGYATIARGWLDGAIPYRDLWDNKGPLLFLWYAASFLTLGETLWAPRVFAALAAGLSVPFVWAAARSLFGPRLAALAAALFALSFANVYLQVAANAEVFMLLPLCAGLSAFALGARSRSPWPFLAAGALTSLAVFTRQSALWALAGYGVWLALLFVRQRDERPWLLRAAAALTAGALLAALPFAVYFAAHGALYDLWYAMFEFNAAWAGEFPLYRKFTPPLLWAPVPLVGGLVFWALAAIGVWRLAVRGDRAGWLIIVFLAFSEGAAQTLGKASAHYSVQLMPGAAIAGAAGLDWVLRRWQEGRRLAGTAVLVAAGVTVGAVAFVYSLPTAEERFEVQYENRDYAKDAVVAPLVAALVQRMTAPGDYIYEWGRESEIYFLADRQPGSRWLHNRAYDVDRSVLTEVIGDLEETRPAVILITLEEDDLRRDDYRPPQELARYLEEHYRYQTRALYAHLYVREDR